MNYLLVCIVATGKGIDLMLKLFASCCVLFFFIDIFSLSIGIAQEFIPVCAPRKEPMVYYIYVRKKQTKFVRKVAGSTPLPILKKP